VTRAICAFKSETGPLNVNARRLVVRKIWVDLGDLWSKHIRGPYLFKKCTISLKISWIARQITSAAELQRVHKNTDCRHVTLTHRLFDKYSVSCVQRAHGGDEANCSTLRPLLDERVAPQ
jgi:hypothetical protein